MERSLNIQAPAIDLEELAVDPYAYARRSAEEGVKTVAVTPMHFPEELVHAAGALPIVVQESNEPVTTGWSHLFPHFCGFSRSNVDAAVKGRLDFFDALIVSDMCIQTRTAFNVAARHAKPRLIYVWWPLDSDIDRWMPTAITRLERCRNDLEEIVGEPISDDAIHASIELFNHHRSLLRELSAVRRANPGLFTGREFQTLVQTGMLVSKEDHIELVESVLADAADAMTPASDGAPVFISGHLCHAVRGEILDLIEESGGVVVGDDLYAGWRYAAADLPTDIPPMEALVMRYFRPGVPCPTKCGAQGDWAEHLLDEVAASGARGVISFLPKHCEAHMFYYPHIKDRFAAAGIPFVLIETEHEVVSLEGTKTRIQALVETLREPRR